MKYLEQATFLQGLKYLIPFFTYSQKDYSCAVCCELDVTFRFSNIRQTHSNKGCLKRLDYLFTTILLRFRKLSCA